VLANQLHDAGIDDWAAATTVHIETFIVTDTSGRLASARSFFAFARRRKLILHNPTTGINHRQPKGFAGQLLDPAAQKRLLRRWTNPDVDPTERTVGMLCLLHAARPSELRALTVADVDLPHAQLRLGRRRHPVPLDPFTVDALTACLAARAATGTDNPHVIVTRGTRAHTTAASAYFFDHVLDPADVKPTVLRHTRIADLAHRTDSRLVASALGMTEEGAMHYLTDSVHREDIAFRPDQ
jgi:integrase